MVFLVGCGGCSRHRLSDRQIDACLENRIRRDKAEISYISRFRHLYIRNYFGTFNYASVVIISSTVADAPAVIMTEYVEGIRFSTAGILMNAWVDGFFFRLQEAFDQGYLSLLDLETIAYRNDS